MSITAAGRLHATATRKAMLRLLPILCLAYFMSYVDRTNIALAKTHLQADVGIGVAAFGLGAGLFFLTYAFLEVPSNLIMYRIGLRRWIARIAITWGAVTALMMFITNDATFYIGRMALGAAEAGLIPVMMFMVTPASGHPGEMATARPRRCRDHQPDVAGEIFMRVTPGTDATYHYIGAEPHIRDGWSSLGDMGRFDADGYLDLHDRRSDIVTVGGVNVYPAEIEAALVEHERVLTAVVIGLPNADTGNHLHAIVHTPESGGATETELRASSPIGSRSSSPRPSNWSISPCATPPARSGGRRCAPHASRRNPASAPSDLFDVSVRRSWSPVAPAASAG
ncbi:2-succinylbenzoate--CoA ligase [Streptomyces hirsutus]